MPIKLCSFCNDKEKGKYKFIRKSDGKMLVKGETDWVFVDASTGRPLAIPVEVSQVFALSQGK